MFWELPVELSQHVGRSTAGWWGSQHTLCSRSERECVCECVCVFSCSRERDCFGLSCQTCPDARVIFIIYHHFFLQGCRRTGACPSITWTRLSVTFKRHTAPHVNKVWTDAINDATNTKHKKRQTPKATAAHLNLLQTHPKCSCCDIFASSKQGKNLQLITSERKLISSALFPAVTPPRCVNAPLSQRTASSKVLSVLLETIINALFSTLVC